MLKTIGYSISSLSVLCLGAVAWEGAAHKPAMLVLLAIGMATSIVGMGFRSTSFMREQRAKGEGPTDLEGQSRAAASAQTRISK